MNRQAWLIGSLSAAVAGAAVAAMVLATRGPRAYASQATPQSAVTLVDRCCFDLDGGGKMDDGIFTVTLKGDVLLALIYEDPDGNKRFEAKDEIKAATLGNLIRELSK